MIALVSPRDRFHAAALEWVERIKRENTLLVATRAVQLEIGAALAKLACRSVAIQLLSAMERDPAIEIAPISEALFRAAVETFTSRPDKEWSLTDCMSFTLMRERAITGALSTDSHFTQAGLEAVLLQ